MMWVGQKKQIAQKYGQKVTCKECIKLLKENGL